MGKWFLRVDDLDTPRNKEGSIEKLEKDLQWLGLNWDGPVILQSQRRGLYRLTLSHLRRKNKLYACRCSRKKIFNDLQNKRQKNLYPGTCRNLQLSFNWYESRLPSLRLKVEEDFINTCGDIILRRSDGIIAYHLASIVDDLTMGITEVVRGVDLRESLPAQLALLNELKQSRLKFTHIPILYEKNGKKLSKREGSQGVDGLRMKGIKPAQLIGYFAASLGLLPFGEKLSAQELLFELSTRKNPLSKIFVER